MVEAMTIISSPTRRNAGYFKSSLSAHTAHHDNGFKIDPLTPYTNFLPAFKAGNW
jgi:hypothetical protein